MTASSQPEKIEVNTADYKDENREIRKQFDKDVAPIFDSTGRTVTSEPLRQTKESELKTDLDTEARHVNDAKTAIAMRQTINENIGRALRKVLLRFVRGVTKEIIKITDPRRKAFLDVLDGMDLNDKEAALILELVEKYFTENSPLKDQVNINVTGETTQFESDLLEIQRYSAETFSLLINVFTKSNIFTDPRIIDKLNGYINKPPAQRQEGDMEPDQKRRFEELRKKIEEEFSKKNPDDQKDLALLMHYLYTRDTKILEEVYKNKIPDLSRKVADILRAHNIDQDLTTVRNLYQEFVNSGGLDPYLKSNGEIAKIIGEFKDEAVFDRLFIKNKDGNREWYEFNNSEETTEYFVRRARQMVNALFQRVDENPGAEFGQSYNELREGYVLVAIAEHFYQLSNSEEIRKKLGDSLEGKKTYDAFYKFLRRKIVFELFAERNYRELFHSLPNVFTRAEPKQWAGHMANFDISQLANFTNDHVVNVAFELWKSYLQERLMMNGNKIPPDLFGGSIPRRDEYGKLLYNQEQVYSYNARDDFVERLRQQIILSENREPEKWEIERAFSLVKGMSLLTMEMSGVLSNANVTESFESIPLAEIIARHNPRFMWGWGRGGRPELMKMAALYMLPIRNARLKGEFWNRWHQMVKDRWIPEDLAALGKKWEQKLNDVNADPQKFDEIVTELTQYAFDHQSTWHQLIQKVGQGDWLSQGSWRINGVKKTWHEFFPDQEWGKENWEENYKWLYQKMGVVLGFAFANDRAKQESFAALRVALKGQGIGPQALADFEERLRKADERKVEQWEEWDDNKREEEIIGGITMNGRVLNRLMHYNEYLEHRQDGIKGESFYQLLLKDPMAFLNDLGQIIPELQTGLIDGTIDPGKLFFDTDDQSKVDKKYKDRWGKFRNYFTARFAVGDKNAENESKKMLRNIMDFYVRLYSDFGVYDKSLDSNTEKGVREKERRMKLARETLFKYLTAAHARAANYVNPSITDPNDPEMRPGRDHIEETDIIDQGWDPNAQYNPDNKDSQDVAEGSIIRRLLFDTNNGLIVEFKKHIQDHGDIEGYFGRVNEHSNNLGHTDAFFQRLAFTWFRRNNINVLPNGDLNHDFLFRAIHASGEDQFQRTYGSLEALTAAQTEVSKLYSRLKRGSVKEGQPMFEVLKDVLKVHDTVKELEPFIGQQSMREIQYYVSVVVSRYFQQHWLKRAPFPIGPLAGPLELGRSTSLSKIFFGYAGTPEFTTDQLREYARWLKKEGCINTHGMWSLDMLLKEIGAEGPKFYMLEVIPNLSIYLALFLLYEYLKEAFEDEVGLEGGGKKK